jgi:hypothetical protein
MVYGLNFQTDTNKFFHNKSFKFH